MRRVKMLANMAPTSCIVAILMLSLAMGQSMKGMNADSSKTAAQVKQLKPQTTCPIMGGEINKKLFVDYKGKRIYVCCTDCLAQVKKDPEAAIKKLESMGQEPETITAIKPNKTGHKKAAVQDTSMKNKDMSGMDMSKDSSMKGMDHSKMK